MPSPGPRSRSRRKLPHRRSWWLLALLAAVVGAGLYFALSGVRPVPRPDADSWRQKAARPATPQTGAPPAEVAPPRDGPEGPAEREGVEREPRLPEGMAEPAGNLALVIDDLGRSLAEVDDLLSLETPMSYSVLPYETRSREVAEALAHRGQEVLLHLPMEPANGENPGPGALTAAMTSRQLEGATRQALRAISVAVGVNNHMGSELTGNAGAMGPILDVLVEEELFFLDSRTSAESVGFRLAREKGLAAAERQVFLDPDPSPEGVREQFARLKELARVRGAAVAIAHPRPATLEVLRQEIPRARAEGFDFVPVSFLLERSPELR